MSDDRPSVLLVASPQMHQPQQHQQRGPQVPPRVQVAMEFLRRLDDKTAVVPLPTYSSDRYEVHPVDGQKLCDEEVSAQATACNLLAQYFAGKLPECQWDKPLPADPKDSLLRLTIKCPRCLGVPMECDVCGGMGEVVVARTDTPLRKGKK